MKSLFTRGVIALILATVSLLFPRVSWAQTGPDLLALSSGTAAANGTVTLSLVLTSPTGSEPADLQWTFTYLPANVVSISASSGTALTNASKILTCSAASGSYTCLASGMNSSIISNGTVATVNLVMASGLTTTAIGMTNAVASSGLGNGILLAATGGVVTGGAVLPLVSLNPTSLTFASQNINTTSTAQAVTLSNPGTSALAITSIAVTGTNSGDFAQTNTCGTSVAAGGNCSISVTFKPTATGTRTASVTITDSATGSPQSFTLTGTGAGTSSVSLNPSSLTFTSQNINTTSAAQAVTLSNTGTAALAITSIAVTGTNSGDFAQTNTCGASVAAGGNCSISVSFKPTATGTRTAAITITDSATGSPQSFTLTGTGVGTSSVSLNPTSLTFTSQNINTTSAAQAVALSNSGTATLAITSIAITGANSGDFAQTNTCGTGVAAGGNCSISVTFTPTGTGTRSAAVTITDNAAGSPHSFALTGTGAGASQVSLSPTSLTFTSQTLSQNLIQPLVPTNPAQLVTLSNMGTAPLLIASIAITGTNSSDFAQTNTCGTSVAPSGNCSISVTFTPTAPGIRVAAVTITDNAVGSPHTFALTGTANQTGSTAFSLSANRTDVPSLVNGSPVTPESNPAGLTGIVVTRGTGSASYAPLPDGNGLTFAQGGSQNSNTAFLSFTGSPISSLFNVSQGDLTFYMKSNYNLVDRLRLVPTEYVFQVDDGSQRIAYFAVTASGSRLIFYVLAGGAGNYYYVPAGLEDALFGQGVLAKFRITWNGSTAVLYIDDTSVMSYAYTPVTPNWSPSASFTIGGTSTNMYSGGYYAVADSVADFLIPGSGSPTSPQVSLNPTSLTFTSQTINTTSAGQGVTLSNTGTAALAITSIAVTGTNAGDFAQTNTCGTSVAAGGSCSITVTFKPAGAGARNAAVTITDNATGSPQSFTLTGTGAGVGAPSVTLNPTSLTFTSQNVNTTSAGQGVTLSNTGTAALAITSIAVTGTNAGDFAQTNTCGTGVAAGGNCSITVTFKPTSGGTRSAAITITDTATGSPQSFTVTGTGVGAASVTLNPTSLTFTSQNVNTTSASRAVTLSNLGTAALTVSSIAVTGANSGDFALVSTCGTSVAAGGSCSISVTFTPTAVGTRSAAVTITDSATGSPQSFTVTGTGVGVPVISLSPANLTFASQSLGTTSVAQKVNLSNTGTAALAITSIAVTGANSGEFAQTNTCGSSVAAGGSCSISVTFTPGGAGTRSGAITMTDNATGSPQSFTLTGTGASGASFLLSGNSKDVPSLLNGASVTPESKPTGLTGTVVVRGAGNVSYAPLPDGDGLTFGQPGCQNSNTAFLSFSGAPVSSLFNVSQGDLTFYVKSNYNLADRLTVVPTEYIFQVDDGSQRISYFAVSATTTGLAFYLLAGGAGNYYYVPAGREDTLFGKGVVAKFRMTWNGKVVTLYMNDTSVLTYGYTPVTPGWSAGASFTISGTSMNYFGGGYYAAADSIADFQIK